MGQITETWLKPYFEAPPSKVTQMWNEDTQEIITMILAGLAKKAGGQLVIAESEMADKGEQILLDINEKAGLVTIVLIPDFVAIGVEKPKVHGKNGELYLGGQKVATKSEWILSPSPTITTSTITSPKISTSTSK